MECLLPYLSMVTVPHIMVGLERMLDYRGVRLERFHCMFTCTATLPHPFCSSLCFVICCVWCWSLGTLQGRRGIRASEGHSSEEHRWVSALVCSSVVLL